MHPSRDLSLENRSLNQPFFYAAKKDPRLRKEFQSTQFLEDALQGQNLLSLLDNKDKSDILGLKVDKVDELGNQGDTAVDMFLDREAIYGSDKHPALVQVLKQLDENKRQRGYALNYC